MSGDVATLDALGYMRITDRSKDVVKSGGEWISSIQLENAAMGHPQVGVGGWGVWLCVCGVGWGGQGGTGRVGTLLLWATRRWGVCVGAGGLAGV